MNCVFDLSYTKLFKIINSTNIRILQSDKIERNSMQFFSQGEGRRHPQTYNVPHIST